MPSKKDNLPLNVEKDIESTGTITYANEVIAIIAGVATSEVEGIAGMVTSGGISDILGRYRNITKGVKVELGSEETSVDLFVIEEYGTPIQKAARDAQENVRKAIETMTGLHVVKVDVHVQGVSFEKENKALEKGQQSAAWPRRSVYKSHRAKRARAGRRACSPRRGGVGGGTKTTRLSRKKKKKKSAAYRAGRPAGLLRSGAGAVRGRTESTGSRCGGAGGGASQGARNRRAKRRKMNLKQPGRIRLPVAFALRPLAQ
jgi:uncharacterized alkaline shock family protein YloU